jgi:hypothetical protein
MLRTFDGLARGYKGSLVPVLSTEQSLFDTVRKLDHLQGSVLPTSSRKISHCKVRCPMCYPVRVVPWGKGALRLQALTLCNKQPAHAKQALHGMFRVLQSYLHQPGCRSTQVLLANHHALALLLYAAVFI